MKYNKLSFMDRIEHYIETHFWAQMLFFTIGGIILYLFAIVILSL